ncbi:hypothetical protein E2C01_045533 [Portunus trituberculatus]|uniref:Uncharacterized protein n=1 Tax=Portunus trituberculatus TaxID=210409 RepID=A0A5B7FV79_PORTR|nr:hypothetical protein [Portunus trituberculatus]
MEVYYIPLFLNLNLPDLGLTQPVLVLYMIERLPTKGTEKHGSLEKDNLDKLAKSTSYLHTIGYLSNNEVIQLIIS